MRIFIVIFLILLAQLCPSKTANADVYIIYKTSTNEVVSIQDDDSAVLESGYTKKVIKGKSVADYGLEYNPLYYKYVDGKFVANSAKISAEENEKIINEEKNAEEILIKKEMRNLGIQSLKSKNVIFKYAKEE